MVPWWLYGLKFRKMLLHDFWFAYHKNEFVLEDETIVPFAEEHVVLGITIDSRMIFYSHLKHLCKKVANKLNALTRMAVTKDDSSTVPFLLDN